jgi:glucokinase
MSVRGGIDLGGTKIQAVVVDEEAKVLGQSRRPTPQKGGPPTIAEEIEATMREAVADAGVETADLAGVGIGSPGVIDTSAGTVAHARNLSDWEAPFPLAATLSDALGPPVYLDNDVHVAVAGEFHLGAGKPYSSLLGVWWGTGVGGGLILDGEPWLGRGAAGEIGHMVVRRGGARCTCGRRGCLEAYAGRAAMEIKARELVKEGEKTKLFDIMEKRDRTRLMSGIWARALEHGDHLAIKLIDRAVEALGAGVASVINLLDLEAVVIGGGLGTRLGEPYAKRIAEAMSPHLFVSERPPAVMTSALGDPGGAIGATLLVPSASGEVLRPSSDE